nr:MAG TPA: hypothetical protein [Caudoviricetes sp.]
MVSWQGRRVVRLPCCSAAATARPGQSVVVDGRAQGLTPTTWCVYSSLVSPDRGQPNLEGDTSEPSMR